MLVLTRKLEERIRFKIPPSITPQTIEVVVSRISSDKVRLGCEADDDVVILRAELDVLTPGKEVSHNEEMPS